MEDKRVTVIGGGIAGLTAAWELSRLGIGVDLVEKSPFLGGHAIQYCCKATDECQQCGACEVEKMLKQVNAAEGIAVHLGAEITTVQRDGGFTLQISKAPQYIDPQRDRELAACYAQCPDKSALRRGYSVNNHPLYAIDPAKADGIRDWCRDNAPAGCIDWNARPTTASLASDAVILAAGFTPYDATRKATYGLGRFANVVTGLEFERNRRLKGAYLRPSDDQPPGKVAFIQCVGSRDEHIGHLWCSTVCCPYALRMASVITHEHPDTAVTMFYMDIQNTGKTFPAFYARCQADMTFVRNIPIDVYPLDNDRLRIRHMAEEEGLPHDEEFDLLVLSIGITPGVDNGLLAELFATGQNEDGFIRSADPLESAGTAAAGVFVAGTLHGPKSIAASMAHAGQAAAEAAQYLRRAQ